MSGFTERERDEFLAMGMGSHWRDMRADRDRARAELAALQQRIETIVEAIDPYEDGWADTLRADLRAALAGPAPAKEQQ